MTGPTGSHSSDGTKGRQRTDPLLVMLSTAVSMELLASFGIGLGSITAVPGLLGKLLMSVLLVVASAVILGRHPDRPIARRAYVGLLGCGAVTAMGLLLGGVSNAVAVGAVLGPVFGIVVLVAIVGLPRHSDGPGRIR